MSQSQEVSLTVEECYTTLELVRERKWDELANQTVCAKLELLASDYLLPGEQWETSSAETKGKCVRQLYEEMIRKDLKPPTEELTPAWETYTFLKGYYLDHLVHEKIKDLLAERLGLEDVSEERYFKRIRPAAFEAVSIAWRKRLQARGTVQDIAKPLEEEFEETQHEEGAGLPPRPELVVSRTASRKFLRTKEELTIAYEFQNRGGAIAKDVTLVLDVPEGFRLVKGETELRKDFGPGQSHREEYVFQAIQEGTTRFPAQTIRYQGPQGKEYFCEVVPLTIEAQFGIVSEVIGRSREFQQLKDLCSVATGGKGQMVFVSGPAGVGKSRLVEEFAKDCKRKGLTVLNGRCNRFHQGMPFLPFRDIFESLFGIVAGDSEQVKRSKMESGLSKLDTELKYLIHSLAPFVAYSAFSEAGQVALPKDRVDPATEREKFFFAAFRLFERYSKSQPMVISLDDLQCADCGTLDLLQFLSAHLREMSVMLIGLYRPDEVIPLEDEPHPLHQTLQQMAKDDLYHEIVLRPLDEQDTYALLDSVFPSPGFPSSFRKVVFEETEGNPLFIISVLRALLESKVIIRQEGKWVLTKELSKISIPDNVEKVIQGRLERLKGDEREELEKASVIGREFLFTILKGLSEREEGELISYLENYISYDLIRELELQEEKFSFTHGKIHEVVYDRIPRLRKRKLHKQVATILESVFSDRTEQMAAVLAQHHYRAGNTEAALVYLLRSARVNARVYSNAEAWRDLALASELLEQLEPSDKRSHFKLQLIREIGNIYKNKADYEAARRSYAECLQYAEAAHDELERAWAIDNLGDILLVEGKYEEAESYYIQCKDIAEKLENLQLLVEVLVDLGELYGFWMSVHYQTLGDSKKAAQLRRTGEACLNRVLEIAPGIKDFESLRRAYNFLGIIWDTEGNYEKAGQAYTTCLEIALQHGLSKHVYNNFGEMYRRMGDFDKALESYGKFLDYAIQVGAKKEELIAYNNIGIVYGELADYDKALEYLDRSLILNQTVQDKGCQIETYIMKGEVLEKQGDSQQALEMYKRSLDLRGNLSKSDGVPEIIRKIGSELYARGELKKAGYFFQKYLAMRPGSGDEQEVREMIGRCH
jgi:tetratricopeptide (TPR) repeat protein